MNLENIKKEVIIKKELELDNDVKIKPNLHDVKVKIEPKWVTSEWNDDVKFWQLEHKIKSEKIKSEYKNYDIKNIKQEIQVIKTEEISSRENGEGFSEDYTLEENDFSPSQNDTILDRDEDEVHSNCSESLQYLSDFDTVNEISTGHDAGKEQDYQYNTNLKLNREISHKCCMCNNEYSSLFSLLLHKYKFCREKLKMINLLKRLLKTCFRKKYRCDMCRRSYLNKSYLRIHLFMHIGKRPFSCKICHESFFVNSSLQKHMKSHIKKNNNQDINCNLRSNERNTENNNVQYQNGRKNFQSGTALKMYKGHSKEGFHCDICKRNFKYKLSFENHLKSHSKKRPFQCKFCDMYFNIHAHLMAHLTFHLKENIFQCCVCKKTFNEKSVLKNHEKRHKKYF